MEGSEFPILQTIPFDKVDIKVLTIEVNHAGSIFPGSKKEIYQFMTSKGYDLHTEIAGQDALFVKKGYKKELKKLGLC